MLKVVSRKEAVNRKRVDCYRCKHSEEIPGSAHRKCMYALREMGIESNPFTKMVSIFGGVLKDVKGMEVVINEIGIKGGWVSFPFNFDPLWIVDCDRYEEEEPCPE